MYNIANTIKGKSALADVFRESGAEVRALKESIRSDVLSGVDGLVISGPFAPLAVEEMQSILNFIAHGGKLAVMLHIPMPVGQLLQQLGVIVSNGVINEQANMIDGKPLDFYVVDLKAHALTRNIDRFAAYGCWALNNVGKNTEVVARTGQKSWVDLTKDGVLGQGDAQLPLGVLVTGFFGKGEFAVFGDDAIFQNQFLEKDNRTLAKNLAGWFAGKSTN